MTLTPGGRYTEDEKESQQIGNINTITAPFTDHPDEDWDEFTPRVGARYAINDDVMVFATYSKGYRSGGSLDATYERDMAGGRAWVRGAFHYLGEHFVNVTNSPELENDDQHLLDASINYSINAFTFSVFGRNLTDEDGYTHGYDVAGLWSYASTRPPLTYGAEIIYNFGGK